MENIHCNGDEKTLSECRHNRLGVHNCVIKKNEAGAICRGKFCFFIQREIILYPLQSQNVMRLISNWLMVQQEMLVE